jgi:predicted NUDIX family NTP pyrophosphohydrolase
MKKRSAGLLIFRRRASAIEVFLVHPGGPFWAKKDEGAWSIPKGEFDPTEEPIAAARREFGEETGFEIGDAELLDLGELKQPSGKIIHVWAAPGEYDPAALRSNEFSLEWPPGSGQERQFPEVDRAAWFSLAEAKRRIVPGQRAFIDFLAAKLGGAAAPG